MFFNFDIRYIFWIFFQVEKLYYEIHTIIKIKFKTLFMIKETESTMTYYSPIDRRNGPVTSGQTPYMRAQAFETRWVIIVGCSEAALYFELSVRLSVLVTVLGKGKFFYCR